MHSHQNEKHEGNNPEPKMKIEKVFKDPLSRQAGEAVMIRRTEGNVLNSKLEFNQPQLSNVKWEIINGWMGSKARIFFKWINDCIKRRSEHQFSHLLNPNNIDSHLIILTYIILPLKNSLESLFLTYGVFFPLCNWIKLAVARGRALTQCSKPGHIVTASSLPSSLPPSLLAQQMK